MSEVPAAAVEAATDALVEGCEATGVDCTHREWHEAEARAALAAAAPLIRQATADEIERLADDPVFRDNIINQWDDHDDSGTAFLRGMKQAALVIRVGGGGGGGQ